MPPTPPFSPEVLAIIGNDAGSAFATFEEQPVCHPDERVTAQVDADLIAVDHGYLIANARPGYLLMTPGTNEGPVGAILSALAPPQHYTHMGMFLDAGGTLRQATMSQERLAKTDDAPTNGYAEEVVRYGWPGTVTQTWADAWDSSRGGPAAVKRHDARTDEDYLLAELGFNPAHVSTPTGVETRWPLVVRPHPTLETLLVVDALNRVARAAVDVVGHYRFYAYTRGLICQDPAGRGPLQLETEVPSDVCEGAIGAILTQLAAGTPKQTGQVGGDLSVGVVCSTFAWAAVAKANAAAAVDGRPEIILDGRPELQHRATNYMSALPRQPRQMTGGGWSPATDGMYTYDEATRTRAAEAFAEKVRTKVKETVLEESRKFLAKGGVDAIRMLLMLGTAGLTELLLLPAGPGKTMAYFYDLFSDIVDDVTNQTANAFAFDDATPASTDSTRWEKPETGYTVSPDDIVHDWAPPSAETGARVHGIYGHNERLQILAPNFVMAPSRTSWRESASTVMIEQIDVLAADPFGGAPLAVPGAEVRIGGVLRAFTDGGGIIHGGQIRSGTYLATAQWTDPATGMLWRSAPEVVTVPEKDAFVWHPILGAPSQLSREILTWQHLDLVNRYAVGNDWWSHPEGYLATIQLDPGRFPEALLQQALNRVPPADRPAEEARLRKLQSAATHVDVEVPQVLIDDWGALWLDYSYSHSGGSVTVKVKASLVRGGETHSHEETVVLAPMAFSSDPKGGVKVEFDLKSGAAWPARAHVLVYLQNIQGLT